MDSVNMKKVLCDRLNKYHEMVVDDNTDKVESSNKFYTEWFDTYDKELASVQYKAPNITAQYFQKHALEQGLNLDCKILDVAAGTGLFGLEVRKLGFSNVDGSDPCEPMIEQAKAADAYTNYFVLGVGHGMKFPFESGSYDASVIVGGMPHIDEDGLHEMIRVVKPGGIFVCGGRSTYYTKDCIWLNDALKKLVSEGKIKPLEISELDENYYMDIKALILVYKVL